MGKEAAAIMTTVSRPASQDGADSSVLRHSVRSGSPFFWSVLRDGNAGDFRVHYVGVEVGVIRPQDGAQFRMDRHPGEERWITERLEHTRESDQLRHVNDTLDAVIEGDAKPMLRKRLDRDDIFHRTTRELRCTTRSYSPREWPILQP